MSATEPTPDEIERVARALNSLYGAFATEEAMFNPNHESWRTDARRVIASYKGERWPV